MVKYQFETNRILPNSSKNEYLKSKIISSIKPTFEYQAFHPSFYCYWELFQEYKSLLGDLVVITDHSDLGCLEAFLHYRETNFTNHLNDTVILTPLIAIDINKKFRSVYRFDIHKFEKNEHLGSYYEKNPLSFICSDAKSINEKLLCRIQKKKGNLLLKSDLEKSNLDKIKFLMSHYKKTYLFASNYNPNFLLFIFEDFSEPRDIDNYLIDYELQLYQKKIQDLSINTKLWSEQFLLKLKQLVCPPIQTTTVKVYKFKNKYDFVKSEQNPVNLQLQQIKQRLNQTKRAIDTKDDIKWNYTTDRVDMYRELKRQLKLLIPFVTNGWMKFYEIFNRFQLVKKSQKEPTSLHLYDPGASLLSLQEYLQNKKLHWYAHTSTNTKDIFGLMNQYPNRWLIDDDINYILKELSTCSPDVIIADGSITIPTNMFNEQELFTSKLLQTQIAIILSIIKKGRNCLIKMFLPLAEPQTVSCLYLLRCFFQKMTICKPLTSHPSSSEVYVICLNYLDINYKTKKELIYDLLNSQINLGVPTEFIKDLIECSTYFVNMQIDSINRSFYYYNNPEKIVDLQTDKMNLAENWIKKYKLGRGNSYKAEDV